jgi:hypothetical protein
VNVNDLVCGKLYYMPKPKLGVFSSDPFMLLDIKVTQEKNLAGKVFRLKVLNSEGRTLNFYFGENFINKIIEPCNHEP